MPCNSLTNFEYEEAFAIPELIKFAGVLAIRHPYLEKGQLIKLGDVARIKLAPFSCYLVFEIGSIAVDVTEIICGDGLENSQPYIE